MHKISNLIGLATVVVMACVCLNGCNTFRGAGTDIKRGGEAIENSARDSEGVEQTALAFNQRH
jgi:predicted small secreted protein